MRIDEHLANAGEPVFSFEFFPPKTPEGEANLYEAVAQLEPLHPAYVSVTYGAGGSTRGKTLEIVSRIREEYDLEAMAHFTCVDATEDELRATLDEMAERGLHNVLALRGDPPGGAEEWTKTEGGLEYSSELVGLIRSDYDFAVAAAHRALDADGADRGRERVTLRLHPIHHRANEAIRILRSELRGRRACRGRRSVRLGLILHHARKLLQVIERFLIEHHAASASSAAPSVAAR